MGAFNPSSHMVLRYDPLHSTFVRICCKTIWPSLPAPWLGSLIPHAFPLLGSQMPFLTSAFPSMFLEANDSLVNVPLALKAFCCILWLWGTQKSWCKGSQYTRACYTLGLVVHSEILHISFEKKKEKRGICFPVSQTGECLHSVQGNEMGLDTQACQSKLVTEGTSLVYTWFLIGITLSFSSN